MEQIRRPPSAPGNSGTPTSPSRLLPGLAAALRPGGLLAASVLHTNHLGEGPSDTVEPTPQRLQMPGGETGIVYRWVLTPAVWGRLLAEHGLTVTTVDRLGSEAEGDPASCCLIRAVRLTDDQR
ncbi:hypothetical protein [Streptosporangium sp. NPDC000396]|uniref:hypothetical protein n=1 Tax=Streptosporangium sp. NPDC000396 TaxID=3366185 RepID=UPI00367BE210